MHRGMHLLMDFRFRLSYLKCEMHVNHWPYKGRTWMSFYVVWDFFDHFVEFFSRIFLSTKNHVLLMKYVNTWPNLTRVAPIERPWCKLSNGAILIEFGKVLAYFMSKTWFFADKKMLEKIQQNGQKNPHYVKRRYWLNFQMSTNTRYNR